MRLVHLATVVTISIDRPTRAVRCRILALLMWKASATIDLLEGLWAHSSMHSLHLGFGHVSLVFLSDAFRGYGCGKFVLDGGPGGGFCTIIDSGAVNQFVLTYDSVLRFLCWLQECRLNGTILVWIGLDQDVL